MIDHIRGADNDKTDGWRRLDQLALFEGEIVADVLVKERALCDASARDDIGDPEVAGTSSVEVQGVGDLKVGDGLGFEIVGEALEGGRVVMDESEVVLAIPDEEGAGAVVFRRESGEGFTRPKEAGSGLKKFGGFFVGVPGGESEVFSVEDTSA